MNVVLEGTLLPAEFGLGEHHHSVIKFHEIDTGMQFSVEFDRRHAVIAFDEIAVTFYIAARRERGEVRRYIAPESAFPVDKSLIGEVLTVDENVTRPQIAVNEGAFGDLGEYVLDSVEHRVSL